MRTVPVRTVVLAIAAVQLGGCSSFLGINFARHSAPAEPAEQVEPALAAAPFTEAGRRQLADNQTGLAVDTFQKALATGEPRAPAINGLGVAFARLGRYDLAHRFFSQAMALDPADGRYADNMARLMRSPEMLAMRRDGDIAARAEAELAQSTAKEAPAQAAKPKVGKIERLSRGEVRIVTAPPQAPPVATTRNASNEAFKPIVRVAFADKEPASVVRIVLPEPSLAKQAETIMVGAAKEAAGR